MFLNVSSRTDIPSYYSKWFYNRIKAGYADVRNPYYPELVTRFSLRKEDVDGFIFCTKDPLPMMKDLHLLKEYRQYWMVTITPYGKDIEPHVRNKHEIMKTYLELSKTVGKKCMAIRYDPILITDKYTIDYHIRAFETIIKELADSSSCCIISFLDLYEKTKYNFKKAREVTDAEKHILIQAFSKIAKQYNLVLKTCAEGNEWSCYGIDTSGCITQKTLEEAFNIRLKIPKRTLPRQQCHCLLGNDIGAYTSCMHGCKYCYATDDDQKALMNHQKHDPDSSFLIGHSKENDILKVNEPISWIDEQLTLF